MRSTSYRVRQTARAYFTEEGRFERILEAAERAQERGDFERSEELYRRAREMRPNAPEAAYTHATALARLRREEAALQALEEAARLGYDSVWFLEEDPSFRPYRDRAAYARIVDAVRKNEEARNTALSRRGEQGRSGVLRPLVRHARRAGEGARAGEEGPEQAEP
jgi:tetratricopeptide (TPR) repeat protein